MRHINLIVLHHSDSDIKSHDDISVIKEWHLARGFSDVGYHYFIKRNGQIQKGRDLGIAGAHCKGVNGRSVGICLHGRDKFTELQFRSLEILIYNVWGRIGFKCDVHPHNRYADKTCPVFDVKQFMKDYVESNSEIV